MAGCDVDIAGAVQDLDAGHEILADGGALDVDEGAEVLGGYAAVGVARHHRVGHVEVVTFAVAGSELHVEDGADGRAGRVEDPDGVPGRRHTLRPREIPHREAADERGAGVGTVVNRHFRRRVRLVRHEVDKVERQHLAGRGGEALFAAGGGDALLVALRQDGQRIDGIARAGRGAQVVGSHDTVAGLVRKGVVEDVLDALLAVVAHGAAVQEDGAGRSVDVDAVGSVARHRGSAQDDRRVGIRQIEPVVSRALHAEFVHLRGDSDALHGRDDLALSSHPGVEHVHVVKERFRHLVKEREEIIIPRVHFLIQILFLKKEMAKKVLPSAITTPWRLYLFNRRAMKKIRDPGRHNNKTERKNRSAWKEEEESFLRFPGGRKSEASARAVEESFGHFFFTLT